MKEIRMPLLGVGMEEGVLVRWLKQPGEAVAKDEAVAEIETDKVTVELPSPASGCLGDHLYPPESVVPVGTTLAVLFEDTDQGPGS